MRGHLIAGGEGAVLDEENFIRYAVYVFPGQIALFGVRSAVKSHAFSRFRVIEQALGLQCVVLDYEQSRTVGQELLFPLSVDHAVRDQGNPAGPYLGRVCEEYLLFLGIVGHPSSPEFHRSADQEKEEEGRAHLQLKTANLAERLRPFALSLTK